MNACPLLHVHRALRAWVVAIAFISLTPGLVLAQFGGQGGGGIGGGQGGIGQGGGGFGGGGQGGGGFGGGGFGGGAAGVVVDAQGVLRARAADGAGLSIERRKAAVAALPGDLRKAASLRKVALSRLEAELAKAHAAGRDVPDEIRKLAGLTRIQYVFVYPAEGDTPGEVVLAGPAEPWIDDAAGRTLGVETGSPTLLLEDLAAAIRCFAPGQPADRILGCSIDPRQEGLAAFKDFLRRVGKVNPQMPVDQLVAGMKDALGTQVVSVTGVSPATHFARVMIEADYRMKLIGIGLEPVPAKKMQSWIELAAAAGGVGDNALKRWYFVPDYDCVRIAEDDLAVELVGRGVKLCTADEVVQPDGTRLSTERSDRASKTFAETFTRKYAEIAARSPVYAQLRNLVDLAVIAAYMQEHDAYGKAGWGADKLRDEKACAIETLDTPREVETTINAVWRQSRLLTPIGGGVTMQPRIAIAPEHLLMDDKGTVAAARTAAKDLPANAWYWD